MENKPQRLAKVMARAGVCSRRQAEVMVLDGLVKVNGTIVTTPAFNVSDKDKIEVDGKKITSAPDETRVWLFYKPKRCITSNFDPEGRDTIFDYLPENMPRVISVGRLDYNSEGLLLLTNDGEYARKLELPATAVVREYRVRIYGKLSNGIIQQLLQGVEVEGIRYAPIEAAAEPNSSGLNTWVRVKLKEGKNREIRKVFQHFGLEVSRLIRIAYGPYALGDMKVGSVFEVQVKQV